MRILLCLMALLVFSCNHPSVDGKILDKFEVVANNAHLYKLVIKQCEESNYNCKVMTVMVNEKVYCAYKVGDFYDIVREKYCEDEDLTKSKK